MVSVKVARSVPKSSAAVCVKPARSVPGSLKDALPEDADGVGQGVQEGQGAREGEEGLVGRRGAGQDQETTQQPVAPTLLYFQVPEKISQIVKTQDS